MYSAIFLSLAAKYDGQSTSINRLTWLGTPVFRGPRSFELSRGIFPFAWNSDIAAEFWKSWKFTGNYYDFWLDDIFYQEKNQTQVPKAVWALLIAYKFCILIYNFYIIVNKCNTIWQNALLKQKKICNLLCTLLGHYASWPFKNLRQSSLRATAATTVVPLSHRNFVCLCICPSVTRVTRQSKTVQPTITKFSLSAPWKTLVSGTVKLIHKFEGGHHKRGR